MLHVVDLNMMHASARHHSDGRPKDPHEAHRRDHILHLRAVRWQALRALLRGIGNVLGRGLSPLRRQASRPQPSKC